jgi:hypothetical protein
MAEAAGLLTAPDMRSRSVCLRRRYSLARWWHGRQRLVVCPLECAKGHRDQSWDGVASGRNVITERGRSKLTTRA